MINDPIADLLTRVRNGYLARLAVVSIPYSVLKEKIVSILKKNAYIVSYTVSEDKREIIVHLNDVRKTKYLPSFRRISRPGQRIYVKSADVRKSRNGLGIYILSTPKGIITGYEAHALGTGGELLCEVY
ncbi:MAG: 30S ribosomal protein S8 [Candidatus Gracilibacteria bacterium]|nr:30S ribosomal protein S8 [Candidatus Gracilibacteria bacterium]